MARARQLPSLALISLVLIPPGCADEPADEPLTCLSPEIKATEVPDLPLAIQSEHLDIHLGDARFMCAGTVREYDEFVEFVAGRIGTGINRRIPYYALDSVLEWCDGVSGSGCA